MGTAEHHGDAPLPEPGGELVGSDGRAGDDRQSHQVRLDRRGIDLLDPLVDQPQLRLQLLRHQRGQGGERQRHVAQRLLEDTAAMPVERALGGDEDDAHGERPSRGG